MQQAAVKALASSAKHARPAALGRPAYLFPSCLSLSKPCRVPKRPPRKTRLTQGTARQRNRRPHARRRAQRVTTGKKRRRLVEAVAGEVAATAEAHNPTKELARKLGGGNLGDEFRVLASNFLLYVTSRGLACAGLQHYYFPTPSQGPTSYRRRRRPKPTKSRSWMSRAPARRHPSRGGPRPKQRVFI